MKILYHQIGREGEGVDADGEAMLQSKNSAKQLQRAFSHFGLDGLGDLRVSEKEIIGKY